jgi:hypothetical protein
MYSNVNENDYHIDLLWMFQVEITEYFNGPIGGRANLVIECYIK